ncbi:hypothetical protein DL98DRAFT_615426 [Cadophora sp. DSE1049]|nr:hypothetical protein DL98DRAFT_615426 [Cadophora sp. DSE1049]
MYGHPTICQDLVSSKADTDAHIASMDPKKSTRPIDLLYAWALFQDLENMDYNANWDDYNACLQILERDCSSDSESEILEVTSISFLVSIAVRSHTNWRFDPTQLPCYSDWFENLRVSGRRYVAYRASIIHPVNEGFLLLHYDAASADPISLYCCWVQCQVISPNWLSPLGLNCIGLLAFQVSKMAEDLFLAKLKLFLYYGADPYLPTACGILPIQVVEYFDCEDLFLRGLAEYGIDLNEFYDKCEDVWDKYDRGKAYKEGMIQKSSGGFSTALAQEDFILSGSGLLTRRIRWQEGED